MSPPVKGISTKATPTKLMPFDAAKEEEEAEGAAGGATAAAGAAAPEDVGIEEVKEREDVIDGGRGRGAGKGVEEEKKKRKKASLLQPDAAKEDAEIVKGWWKSKILKDCALWVDTE